MRQDLSQMPVQTYPCITCPFEGSKPVAFTPGSYARYVANVVYLKGQHRCHSVNNQMLCRGGRNPASLTKTKEAEAKIRREAEPDLSW